ncbi:MAG TPA: succinate dehydrogenase, cytochrome b556 subunit [Gammaproteobacteria bacterium]|nr:succinate dehydrogenase, cytochrome b556 subunit [Gammaproteobacteria bacterium]
MITNSRPCNINPFSIRLTITAFVSGLHRISGFGVFLLIPFMLWLLEKSLVSSEGFDSLAHTIHQPFVGIVIALFIAGLLYHFLAGIRHLLFDIHIGDSLRGGRIGAFLVILITALLFIGTCFWIWG